MGLSHRYPAQTQRHIARFVLFSRSWRQMQITASSWLKPRSFVVRLRSRRRWEAKKPAVLVCPPLASGTWWSKIRTKGINGAWTEFGSNDTIHPLRM
ncbi:hypothetical protein BDA96_04G134000 [Sorghum bicolor]|uniref:Uncharacterized protein n=1 Tax=Sorghum bicolor TaxID=4558 RepID=A0A921UHY5_SORBI|nr:hypothetical protein BDA96_04G134000 [Sorghum bicolor]